VIWGEGCCIRLSGGENMDWKVGLGEVVWLTEGLDSVAPIWLDGK